MLDSAQLFLRTGAVQGEPVIAQGLKEGSGSLIGLIVKDKQNVGLQKFRIWEEKENNL